MISNVRGDRCLVKSSLGSPGLLFTKTVSALLWSNRRDNCPPTDRWSCTYVSMCVWGVLAAFGDESILWGGGETGFGEEEEVENCEERSPKAQLVRPPSPTIPTSTSCCLKRARQPACLPGCMRLPLSFSFSFRPLTPPSAILSMCPPTDSAQLLRVFCPPPLPLCTLTPTKQNYTYKQVWM